LNLCHFALLAGYFQTFWGFCDVFASIFTSYGHIPLEHDRIRPFPFLALVFPVTKP
jgi:hypothetical protein